MKLTGFDKLGVFGAILGATATVMNIVSNRGRKEENGPMEIKSLFQVVGEKFTKRD